MDNIVQWTMDMADKLKLKNIHLLTCNTVPLQIRLSDIKFSIYFSRSVVPIASSRSWRKSLKWPSAYTIAKNKNQNNSYAQRKSQMKKNLKRVRSVFGEKS